MNRDQLADHAAFVKETLDAWGALVGKLFPNEVPESANWTDIHEITHVLNLIANEVPHNHIFFPNGGGMDLKGATTYHEKEAIELRAGFPVIVRPQSLSLEYFGKNLNQWAYFRLETGGLHPTGVYQTKHNIYEEVTELGPGKYADRSVWDDGHLGFDKDGNERSLPPNARCISRFFEGAFVIVPKGSPYNQESSTYDGRHNKMDAKTFRTYISRSAEEKKLR